MPLPDRGFDPTEASIPWKACVTQGWKVTISTEHGSIAEADLYKLKGPLPGLMSAGANAQAAYQEMTKDSSYLKPIPYNEIKAEAYQALLLPGGDALGMRQYLDNQELRSKVFQFWQQGKLIGAMCHGVLVLARTIDPQTGRSVLYGHKVTAPPKTLDRFAFQFDNWLLKRGYIMYSSCAADEVRACLEHAEDLASGPGFLTPYAISDGNLVTSRWYHDAEVFADRFTSELKHRLNSAS